MTKHIKQWTGRHYSAGYTDTMTNAEYHSQKWAVPASTLKTILTASQSATLKTSDETPSMTLGTAIHSLVLEGVDAFEEAFTVPPLNMNLRTKEGKAWKHGAEAAGLTVLSEDKADRIRGAAAAVTGYAVAAHILDAAPVRERSIFWQDERTGTWCRCRPDAYNMTTYADALLVDLKTCANIDRFHRDFYDYAYDVQMAFYLRGLQSLHNVSGALPLVAPVVVVAVETNFPHRVGVFEVAASVIADADALLDVLLDQMTAARGDGIDEIAEAFRASAHFCGNREDILDAMPSWIAEARRKFEYAATDAMRAAGYERKPF